MYVLGAQNNSLIEGIQKELSQWAPKTYVKTDRKKIFTTFCSQILFILTKSMYSEQLNLSYQKRVLTCGFWPAEFKNSIKRGYWPMDSDQLNLTYSFKRGYWPMDSDQLNLSYSFKRGYWPMYSDQLNLRTLSKEAIDLWILTSWI